MLTDNKPEWHEIYKKLADELLKFYTNWNDFRNENFKYNYEKGNEYFSRFINSDQNKLAGEIFYEKCKSKSNFFSLFNWAKNISEKSIDPFHIFVSFNNNNTTLDKKRERLQFYFDVLEYKINVDNLPDNRTFVPHIPVMQLLTNRTKVTQDNVWKFFVGILENDKEVIKQGFQDYEKWYGIGFVVITEMLFWVDSSKYISLDKNTFKLLLRYDVINRIPNQYKTYFALLQKKEELNLSDNIFRIIVKYAYDNEKPENKPENKELFKFLGKSDDTEYDLIDKDEQQIIQNIKFQLIAIKLLDNENKKYTKNLLKNELYQFNKSFEFENNVIKYYRKRDMNLYKIANTDININVIVGENGSGKSTLLELAFMIINNISRRIFEKHGLRNEEIQVEYIDGINAELYFVTNHLYKIIIKEKNVTVEKFEQINFNDEIISYGKETDCTTGFSFENLYYTNHINYSLHSLNQNYFGNWIYNLFHKNDGYQTPIVLEPYRDKGNIDINLLQSLMKSRLLSYILDNSNESFKQLTKKAKAKNIILSVDYFKFTSYTPHDPNKKDFENLGDNLKDIFTFDTDEIIKIISKFIDNHLGNVDFDRNMYINDGDKLILKENFKDIPIEFFYMMYILNKLDSISSKYKDFKKYQNYKTENKLGAFLEAIKEDVSHSTFKIRQAIYNLKYIKQLKFQNKEMTFQISEFSNIIINEILSKESEKDSDLRIDDLIPSSIFKVDIILENNESFDSLSSGEKQKIFVINSIMYHLKNIASKNDGYRNINIVLDEIELYFHPEMQRNFINDLLYMLENNEYIYNCDALNFIFVTHSPFILSDVIDNNLLKLDKNARPFEENKRTLGANIHELLANGFFISNSMGEFASKQINEIVKFYTKVINLTDENLEELKKEYSVKKDKFYFILEHIGEDYIRGVLKSHIEDIELRLIDEESLTQKRIAYLEAEIEKLKSKKNDSN